MLGIVIGLSLFIILQVSKKETETSVAVILLCRSTNANSSLSFVDIDSALTEGPTDKKTNIKAIKDNSPVLNFFSFVFYISN